MVIANLNCAETKKLIFKKDLSKLFKRDMRNKFYFPPPNYGTRALIFKSMIENAGGYLTNQFDLNTFAHITEGYMAGHVISSPLIYLNNL